MIGQIFRSLNGIADRVMTSLVNQFFRVSEDSVDRLAEPFVHGPIQQEISKKRHENHGNERQSQESKN
jgi:hypothetical protein